MMAALSLIALVLGYKVFVEASKEKEGLKILGQAIGVLVMVLSILLVGMSACPKYGGGPCGKGYSHGPVKAGCPLMGQASEPKE